MTQEGFMGRTGDAAGIGHGHIEIGFSDAAGDPLNHHGLDAATPAGQVMRAFLVTLSESLRQREKDAKAASAAIARVRHRAARRILSRAAAAPLIARRLPR